MDVRSENRTEQLRTFTCRDRPTVYVDVIIRVDNIILFYRPVIPVFMEWLTLSFEMQK